MTQVINIDWKECLKDSPRFRSLLHEQERDIDSFENHLEKVIKYSDYIVENGKSLQGTYNNFLAAFQALMVHFKDDPQLLEAIGKFNETSTHWHSNYQAMLERCYHNVSKVLSSFVKTDVKKAKEVRKSFHKGSEDVDSAFAKNAQVSKSRREECMEANSQLSICRNHFKRTSLDYVFQLNSVQMKKKMQMLSCMSTHFTSQDFFLHQMNDTFDSLRPYVAIMKDTHQDMVDNTTTTKTQMKAEIEAVLNEDMKSVSWEMQRSSISDYCKDDSSWMSEGVSMEGYLYKRTSNAFKSWVRRWFVVEGNQLLYCSQHRSRDGAVVLENDLRLCNVVPFEDTERRFCFQVVSPVRSHLLQADNGMECREWIESIQEAARMAYNNMISPSKHKTSSSVDLRSSSYSPFRSQSVRSPSSQSIYQPSSHVQDIIGTAGNDVCCDCGHTDAKWASFNLGVTLCIECSGIHRSFGVHRSKVRSVTLDAWEDDQVQVMRLLGNRVVNRIYERGVVDGVVVRATPSSNREVREAWITEKYIKKSFVRSEQPVTLNIPPTTQSSTHSFTAIRSSTTNISSTHSSSTTPTNISPITLTNHTPTNDSPIATPTNHSPDATTQDHSTTNHLPPTTTIDPLPLSDTATQVPSQEEVVETYSEVFSDSIDGENEQQQANEDELSREVCDWLDMQIDGPIEASQLLCRAATQGCLAGMLRCLAEGADINYKAAEMTPLIASLNSGQLPPVEFLLLNGAKVDATDQQLQSPLHHAALLGNANQICLLLKRKANQHLKNSNQQDALAIAIDKADANVVTLLRLARLNEEMRSSEGGYDNANEDMFAEVFKDFSCISAKNCNNEDTPSNNNIHSNNRSNNNKNSSSSNKNNSNNNVSNSKNTNKSENTNNNSNRSNNNSPFNSTNNNTNNSTKRSNSPSSNNNNTQTQAVNNSNNNTSHPS